MDGENETLVDSDLFDGIEDVDRDRDSEPLFTPEDRPRGILSKTDREYLCGLKDYAQPQTDANRRQDIRERVKNGMLDFVLLFLNLPKDEHEKIFTELDAADDLDISVHLLIAFLYLGMEDDRHLFEDCIERGVYWGAAAADGPPSGGKISNVDLSLDLEFDPDIDRLVERLENGEELTDAEIGAVAKAGRLEPEHLDDLDDSGPSLADLRIR